MSFDIKEYLSKSLWETDDYLIVPPDGVKKCRICNTRKYSVSFFEHDEFVNGHFPMCAKCLRSVKFGVLSRTMLDDTGFIVTCKICKHVKGLGQMGMSYSNRKVKKTCLACIRKDFKRFVK